MCDSEFCLQPIYLLEASVGHNLSFPTTIKGQPRYMGDKIEPSEGKQKMSGLEGNIFL